MVYCINPLCNQRQNPEDSERCLACGTPLLINDRIRLLEPLRLFNNDPYSYTEVFEVDDAGTKWHPVRERRVMKVLKWSEPKLVELMRREVFALQVIKHPGIPKATIDDYFTFTPHDSPLELHCLVMQRFEGQNLEQWIKSYGRISQSLALRWLKQLVDILDLVHRSGFFHRDIKPDNIIIQPNGQLALIDFGGVRQVTNTYLAKVSGNGGTSTGVGSGYEITAVRTARYSPLEQINGQAVPQSDFYALGRTFVYLVTGISLIKLKTDQTTGRLIWRNKAPQIDKPLADFLDDLMAPFPGQRPQTTQVILQRLDESLLPFSKKPECSPLLSPTPGNIELTVTIKINSFPALVTTLDNGWKQFDVDTGDHLFTIVVKQKVFKKLELAQENYSHWVASITGKSWEKDQRGFVLRDPSIRISEKKPNEQKEAAILVASAGGF